MKRPCPPGKVRNPKMEDVLMILQKKYTKKVSNKKVSVKKEPCTESYYRIPKQVRCINDPSLKKNTKKAPTCAIPPSPKLKKSPPLPSMGM